MNDDLQKYRSKGIEYIPVKYLSQNQIRSVELITDHTGGLFVRKRIPYSDDGPKLGENFYFTREVTLLFQSNKLGLPFVNLVEYQLPSQEEEGFIITEFMEGGNLMDLINKKFHGGSQPFHIFSDNLDYPYDDVPFTSSNSNYQYVDVDYNNTRKVIIMYGVAKAIKFLHENSIFHRDIKPENILLNRCGEPYLSDFGLARKVFQNNQNFLSGKKGTIPYMSPEVFKKDTVDLRGDIYAFGVTVLIMLSGELKFEMNGTITNTNAADTATLHKRITQNIKYIIPDNIPQCFRDLISKCCETEPDDRPQIDKIISDFETGALTFSDVNQNEFRAYMNKLKKKKDEK